ncbi:MAG TPA: Uma2 family endonuclease [Gemmataceae bacterium]|jgi:Uma2 family endonuclease|nr:Uma2 family endonuclease [Gemmataceae bacterium]
MSVLAAQRPFVPEKPPEGGRVVLRDVPWETYVAFTETLNANPGLRTTYDRGSLELMSTSNLHEWLKTRLARFLEIIAEELGVAIQPGGNTTFRSEELDRGFEPDACFWIATEARMRVPVAAWEPSRDPPPDLIVEVEVTRSALNRMSVFAAYGVPEVWRFDGSLLHIHRLRDNEAYEKVAASPTFPSISVSAIARFLTPDAQIDYLTVLRQFREWVRSQLRSA